METASSGNSAQQRARDAFLRIVRGLGASQRNQKGRSPGQDQATDDDDEVQLRIAPQSLPPAPASAHKQRQQDEDRAGPGEQEW